MSEAFALKLSCYRRRRCRFVHRHRRGEKALRAVDVLARSGKANHVHWNI